MDKLTERIAWAIETIKLDRDLDKGIKDVELAKILGTDKNTLARYRRQQGLAKGEVIDKLVHHYHFSPQWLFHGNGEPFPGARARYPEVCGPEPVAPRPQAAPVSVGPEIRISEALAMCARVLESGTSYATALYLNIQHFDRAVAAESRIPQIEARLVEMEGKMDSLINENKTLRSEVNRLKETYEGPFGGRDAIANASA